MSNIAFTNGGTTYSEANNNLVRGMTVAIVDPYKDPDIVGDLHQFETAFSLPQASTAVTPPAGDPRLDIMQDPNYAASLYAEPPLTSNWGLETSIDVEWFNAIAPLANIDLFEVPTNTDLLQGAYDASKLPGVIAISMSWGNPEGGNETNDDFVFQSAGQTFLAASGDYGAPPSYPAISPYVVAIGGTALTLNTQNAIQSEIGWGGSGGGLSTVETAPTYQNGLIIADGSSTISANDKRANPDVSYDADPNTGFPIYDSYDAPPPTPPSTTPTDWIEAGGTSIATPQWAAITIIADQGRALANAGSLTTAYSLTGYNQTLPALYSLPAGDWHDIVSGYSYGSPTYEAGPGYDLVSGNGTPVANKVVSDLIAKYTISSPSSLTAGNSLTVTVTAVDAFSGTTLTHFNGAVQFSSNDSLATLPGNVTLTNGVGTFTVTLKTAGSDTVTVVGAGSDAGSNSATATVTVSPANLNHFTVTAPAIAHEGSAFAITVSAADVYGNTITNFSGTVQFAKSDSATGAAVPANYTFGSGDHGVHVFTNGVIFYTVATDTVTATDTLNSAITGSAAVTVGQTHFAISVPSSTTAGNNFVVTVTAEDSLNNTVTGYSGTVHLGSSDMQAQLSADSTLTSGVGSFAVSLNTAGSQTITATDKVNGSPSVTSATISVTAGSATHLAITAPATATAGMRFHHHCDRAGLLWQHGHGLLWHRPFLRWQRQRHIADQLPLCAND